MADATKYGNAIDFDVDLHSIYAAYLGLFDSHGNDWWDKSWGGFFTTFNDFLGFGWEVMVVVDCSTGRPHIAVRREQIGLFAKMIRTRFGESLPKDPPTTLPLNPVPTRTLSLRRLITIHDLASYRKLSQTLPAAELSYLRSRVKTGEVDVAEQLFYAGGSSGERDTGGVGVRDNGVGYTWACVKTTWWEKGGAPSGLIPGVGKTQAGKGVQAGKGLVLEVGIATLRCANLRAVNVWPPVPADNYRKSHFVAEEWVDKRTNSNPPNHPRAYAFGKSRYVAEKNVEKILDATLAALASQENDGMANTLVLLTVGDPPPLPLPASSTLPNNILHLDVLALEFNLLRRAQAQNLPNTPDRRHPLASLPALLQTLQIPIVPFAPLGNAGNDAYYTLIAFQKLMMAETRLPDVLFTQPDTYMPNLSYSGYPTFPSSGSMRFQQYPALPMPPPIGSPGTVHRDSTGSRHANSSFPSSPSGRTSRQASTSRPRPASMGDMLSAFGEHEILPSRAPEITPSESAPFTGRRDRGPITRSASVFWDSAAYAGSPPPDHLPDSDLRGRQRESTLRAHISPNTTGGSTGSSDETKRCRHTSMLPPSSLRSKMKESPSTRSISWEGDLKHIGVVGQQPQDHKGGDKSIPPSESRSSTVRQSSAGPRRSGLSSSSLSKDRDQAASTGTGSSTKHSSGSSHGHGNEMKNGNNRVNRSSTNLPELNEKEKEKDKKDKKKSEKSVKDIAGALARFWVG